MAAWIQINESNMTKDVTKVTYIAQLYVIKYTLQ